MSGKIIELRPGIRRRHAEGESYLLMPEGVTVALVRFMGERTGEPRALVQTQDGPRRGAHAVVEIRDLYDLSLPSPREPSCAPSTVAAGTSAQAPV